MRLQTRIILLMILFFLLFVLLGSAATRLLLGPVILAAEEEVARVNLMRVASALQRESEHLAILITDWAYWDESYRFVQDRCKPALGLSSNCTWFVQCEPARNFSVAQTLLWMKYLALKSPLNLPKTALELPPSSPE